MNNKLLHTQKENIVSYYLYLLGLQLAKQLPLKTSLKLSELNGFAYRYTHYHKCRTVSEHLKIIADFTGSKPIDCREPFIAFSQTVAEFLFLGSNNYQSLIDTVSLNNESNLKHGTRGVMFLSAHTGNWELAAAKLVVSGYDLMVVVQPHPEPHIDKLFRDIRNQLGVKCYTLGKDIRPLISHLKNGGLVAILGDRDFTGHGQLTDFLGANIMLPTGYIKLAKSTNSVIVPAVHSRKKDNSFIDFSNPIDAQQEDALRLCKAHLESIISNNPGAWTVFERTLFKEPDCG